MLSPITGDRKLRKFAAYDLEWMPGTKPLALRLVGIYDREHGYRAYTNMRAFLDYELCSRNRGRWFYAHAGGLADVQFVLDEIIKWNLGGDDTYSAKACFSGSSAIIVKIQRGHNVWYFVDSLWLLKNKLSDIADFLGMKKGGMEDPDETLPNAEWEALMEKKRAWFSEVSLDELRDYNEQDCRILYEAIYEFQLRLLEYGGQLQMTIASCAMHLFRRKFLTQEIVTNDEVNETSKEAYNASRVEMHRRHVKNAKYFDINSCFPYAMTFDSPGEYLGSSRRIPDHGLYIADVDVEVPEMNLPPLPLRTKSGRIFFPIGKWRNWYTSVDIELLQRAGGRVLKVHEVFHFESFNDLSAYAKTIYEDRRAADDVFTKMVLKYLLNSLYGKFAESRMKIALWIDPDDTSDMDMLFPGAFLKEEEIDIEHAHVPISAFIGARGRDFLWTAMDQCREVFYCDTDGFATSENLSASDILGKLKLEKEIADGYFIAPKIYHMDLDTRPGGVWDQERIKKESEGKPAPPSVINRAKGFSRMNTERWFMLAEGESIGYERLLRIRERWRRGLSNPVEERIEKRLQMDKMIPKRYTYPDGYTRPWFYEEIKDAA